MTVDIKSFNQRLGLMIRTILTDTGISDLRVGSVISTILQAAAQSDFEIETSIVEMIKLFSVDTTEGADLDMRAAEFNLKRYTSTPSSDVVRIIDTSFVKKSSKIYIGFPPPVIGDIVINVEDASNFPSSGQVYIGRGTGNYEGPISYSSLQNNISYWTITLSSPITKNHIASEFVILAQGGNRVIQPGVIVKTKSNNFSPSVSFNVSKAITLVDGETEISGVPVIAMSPGSVGNVPTGSISLFDSPPFFGAEVTNLSNFTNGRDVELDSSLRSRIKNAIQLIARGTKRSILQAVVGISDPYDNKRVTSATLREPANAAVPAQLFIDDGTGFEPSFLGQGMEKIVDNAAGSEKMIQIAKYPITPPLQESTNSEPYAIYAGYTLSISVDQYQETITFQDTDFKVAGLVKANEIVDVINARSTLVSARSAKNGTAIILVAKRFIDGTDPEEMQISEGSANDYIKFPTTVSKSISLYKNGILLSKNPASAIVFSKNRTQWNFSLSSVAARLKINVDDISVQDITLSDVDFLPYGTTYKTATLTQWSEVLSSKITGITVSVESGMLKIASNKQNSTASILRLIFSDNLLGRSSSEAKWISDNIIRYVVSSTDGIEIGDFVSASSFNEPINNGVFEVLRIFDGEFIDVINMSRNNNDDDEVGSTGEINPNKEDLVQVIFGEESVSLGANSQFTLNRFNGSVELSEKLSEGDNVTAGTEFTRAYVDSSITPDRRYNFPYAQDVAASFYLSIDSNCERKIVLLANGDMITQAKEGTTDYITLQSNRSKAFSGVNIGDYIYLSTKSSTGIGSGYMQWFPSYATGVFEITGKYSDESLQIKNPHSDYPAAPAVLTGYTNALDDIQAFFSDGLVQKIPLQGMGLLPGSVSNQINAVLQYGNALVFGNKLVRIQSSSYDSSMSKIFILAVAGSAKEFITVGSNNTANEPHVGFSVATTKSTTFLKLKDGLDGFFGSGISQGFIFGKTTDSSMSFPYIHEDSDKTFLSDIEVNDIIKYVSGNNQEQIVSIKDIDSDTDVILQDNGSLRPLYINDKYIVAESYRFSPYDKIIVELDQDSSNKTFLIPLYRTGIVKGTSTTAQIDAYDADSAPGTDFNNTMWHDFSFRDFGIMFKARNIYRSSSLDSVMIVRSSMYGKVGEKIRFGILYPTQSEKDVTINHKIDSEKTTVNLYLGSGAPRLNISNVGSGYKITRNGEELIIKHAGVGSFPNFSGNGVIYGDIASISDSAFTSKSAFFGGSGRVISVTPDQLAIRLTSSANITTAYPATSAQDSGSGTTTTYAMANTGILAYGDKIQISGFSKSINNGMFSIVGVSANTSVTVNHSNRVTVTKSTVGYRITSNLAYLQFSGSINGEIGIGDSIAISGMSLSVLNSTFIVTDVITTYTANDTVVVSVTYMDIPLERTVTGAVWNAGNIVRYSCPNTVGISPGNYVNINGFSNASNNGQFLVTNIINNVYIEVVSSRNDNTDNETGVSGATARPTYFINDSGGVVKVINNETSSALVELIITQATSRGISVFPLMGNDMKTIVDAINDDPLIKNVISASLALGYLGSENIELSTFDEPMPVGYNHGAGESYIHLYDGENYVSEFHSSNVNPFKNFVLKKPIEFHDIDYDMSTAPNLQDEQPGEHFKLIPTTYRNIDKWFTKSNITSLSISALSSVIADGGRLQIASRTIGSSGAVKITGGSGNGIKSFLKIPASFDSGAIRCQVNNSDQVMLAENQIIKVENALPSRKPKNFNEGSIISVDNIDGTSGIFKSHPRTLTLSTSNSIIVSDVSSTYGRSPGIVWRWTAGGTPSSPFTGVKNGDVLHCDNTSFDTTNRSPNDHGDLRFPFFPIVKVDTQGQWIEIHNPFGVAEGPISLSSYAGIFISPSFAIEWKHYLSDSDSVSVESLGFLGLSKYTWISGVKSPSWEENSLCVDDYVYVSGNSFSPNNRGMFKVVSCCNNYFVVENAASITETISIDNKEDIRIFYADSVIAGDKINVSDISFLESNRGTFQITNFGSSSITKSPRVKVLVTNSSTQSSISLSGVPNSFFFTDGIPFSSYKKIVNFSIDPSDSRNSIVYLTPPSSVHKMSNSYKTSITPIQKFRFSSDVAIGSDGYRYYVGLLAAVQKTVDGFEPDSNNYPGYKAAGAQIEIEPPRKKVVDVTVIIKTSGGINIGLVNDSIKSSILNYVKGLGIGEDVIISEITAAVMTVEGVESCTLFDPDPADERIVIQDNEKAIITIENITISSR